MSDQAKVEVYQLRVYLRGVNPMIWRRLLMRSDNTIADLHDVLQIVMTWYDVHLHHFIIRGKRYGVAKEGTWGFMDQANLVQLCQFDWRINETFVYEYNFYDEWQLIIRLEAILPFDSQGSYPRCVAGKGAAPPEDCGGAWRFMELKRHFSVWTIEERLLAILSDPDLEETRWDYAEEVKQLMYWLHIDRFDHRTANERLREHFQPKEVDYENPDTTHD